MPNIKFQYVYGISHRKLAIFCMKLCIRLLYLVQYSYIYVSGIQVLTL